MIASVHMALQGLVAPQQVEREKPQPAVGVRKSVTPDFLISLEDGKPYKSLKRHLTRLGLTPQAYREKWGLPPDYPMVAANYALQRSELAKSMGLGEKRRKQTAAEAAVTSKEEETRHRPRPQSQSAVLLPRRARPVNKLRTLSRAGQRASGRHRNPSFLVSVTRKR